MDIENKRIGHCGGFAGRCRMVVWLALCMLAVPLHAKTLIKLTTLAPKDSSYHQALQKMGQQWAKATGGDIDLVIYPGGIQGGESAMIKRMRIGQIQAAMITTVGLSDIEPSVSGLQSMPMMLRDQLALLAAAPIGPGSVCGHAVQSVSSLTGWCGS